MITKEEILKQTDGGLYILKRYFPDAAECADTNRKFKLHEEKTPSASCKKLQDGTYIVTDFGVDSKGRTAVDLYIHHFNIDFKDAIKKLAEEFRLVEGDKEYINEPIISSRPAKEDEKEKHYEFKVREFTVDELKILGRFVSEETCKRYNLHALESYTYIKDRKALTFKSSPEYPQFLWDFGDFKKLYKPLEQDKKYRFVWIGSRPKDFVFGLKQAQKAFAKNFSEEDETPKKLKEIVIASGERDALNIAAAGYLPVCYNSETAEITSFQITELERIANDVYNVPDLDATGVMTGTALALKFIKIKTIWLPDVLKEKEDFRGNPCKDVTDYFKYYDKFAFNQLVYSALPFRFWKETYQYDRKGNSKGMEYRFTNSSAYEFLQGNGFYRIEDKNSKTGFSFVRLNKKVVEKIPHTVIRDFINNYLKENNFNADLRDMVYKTNQLSENSLMNLPIRTFDFQAGEKDCQYMFFKNETWKITKKGIEVLQGLATDKYVWKSKIIEHKVKKIDPLFRVIERDGAHSIEINEQHKDFSFMKFILNTGNQYWNLEELEEKQRQEILLHFINKITSIGYLLHKYKDPGNAKCIYAIDMRESSYHESNGGTGKSLFFKAIRELLKIDVLNGRDKGLLKNNHVYENVDEYTDMIHVEDCDAHIDFNFFFNSITSNLKVNPKHQSGYEIPFSKSPKFAFDTNYALRKVDQSIMRRIHFIAFSDYYHKKDRKYSDEQSPMLEFKKSLFIDYTEEEYNLFFNFVSNCIETFLQFGLLNAPMENIERRNLRHQMGEEFLEWAEDFFCIPNNVNTKISKKEIYNTLLNNCQYNRKDFSSQRFKKAIENYCIYKGWDLNPEHMCTDKKNLRIIDNNVEMLFIKTHTEEEVSW